MRHRGAGAVGDRGEDGAQRGVGRLDEVAEREPDRHHLRAGQRQLRAAVVDPGEGRRRLAARGCQADELDAAGHQAAAVDVGGDVDLVGRRSRADVDRDAAVAQDHRRGPQEGVGGEEREEGVPEPEHHRVGVALVAALTEAATSRTLATWDDYADEVAGALGLLARRQDGET